MKNESLKVSADFLKYVLNFVDVIVDQTSLAFETEHHSLKIEIIEEAIPSMIQSLRNIKSVLPSIGESTE